MVSNIPEKSRFDQQISFYILTLLEEIVAFLLRFFFLAHSLHF